ncbi:MAG TPA: Ldh family oxidoreductase [Spirochaetia bacterium]|nr:Ldh family oxidoreductase [Spirochaetia bacterium]
MVLPAETLKDIGIRLFAACGASARDAETVASELVEASLMGLDSHGVMRYAQYVDEVLAGTIQPKATPRIERETATTAVVDCGSGFGIASACRMVEIVIDKARAADLACVVSTRCQHVGRLGSYAQKVARAGLVGLAAANSSRQGHWVAPWGGREGRLATNPLAFAAPTSGDPLIVDMSTSMIAEGKIRILKQNGAPVPPGSILDGNGNPTTDPNLFYAEPHGTILPFGSPTLGYKGFGLGLLVEILGSSLAGVPLTSAGGKSEYTNGLFLLAINPEPLAGPQGLRTLVDELCAYVTSSRPAPGHREVVVPGALDFRTRARRLEEGIPVAEGTWREIERVAGRLSVTLPPVAGG